MNGVSDCNPNEMDKPDLEQESWDKVGSPKRVADEPSSSKEQDHCGVDPE